VELVGAGQHAQQLLGLKVAHAHHARGLVRLGALRVAVVLVGRQLLYVALVEPLLLGLTTTKRAVPAKSSLTLGCSHLSSSGQGRAQQTSKQNFFVIISPCKASNFGKDYKANKDSKTNKQSMTNKDSKANNKTNKNSKTFSRKTILIDSPSAEVNV